MGLLLSQSFHWQVLGHSASSEAEVIIRVPEQHTTHIYHFKEIIGCENLGDGITNEPPEWNYFHSLFCRLQIHLTRWKLSDAFWTINVYTRYLHITCWHECTTLYRTYTVQRWSYQTPYFLVWMLCDRKREQQ